MGLSLERVMQRGAVWCGGFATEAQELGVSWHWVHLRSRQGSEELMTVVALGSECS